MRRTSFLVAFCVLLAGWMVQPVLGADGPYIFSWNMRDYSMSAPGYTPLPHAGHDLAANSSTYVNLYNQLYSAGSPMGLMIQDDTNPLDGTKDPNALTTVMGYVPRLDFVFADLEGTNKNAEMQTLISQVRGSSNANVKNAWIGNYNDFAGAVDNAAPYPNQVDRSAEDAFYRSSGENVAMPSIYPYAFYETHVQAAIWGTNVAPNMRAALFWAPLERFSEAKRNLPAGDLLIPWTARFIGWGSAYDDAPVPPREDVTAMIEHIRLRGADGFYRLISILDNSDPNPVINPAEEAQDSADMVNAWHSLDSVFTGAPVTILNLSTDKGSGLEWSGVHVGDKVAILISNLSDQTQRILLPDIAGLPEYSDYVGSGQHLLKIYVVPEPATLGLAAMALCGGLMMRRRLNCGVTGD